MAMQEDLLLNIINKILASVKFHVWYSLILNIYCTSDYKTKIKQEVVDTKRFQLKFLFEIKYIFLTDLTLFYKQINNKVYNLQLKVFI